MPRAWAKMRWMFKKAGELEMSGFCISSPDDPFLVVDFYTIKQECTGVETLMDDDDFARYMIKMAKAGVDPCRCMRIWVHSHPFSSAVPSPSGTDEDTFKERTGADSEWAIMIILGKGSPFLRLKVKSRLMEEEFFYDIDWEIDWTSIVDESIVAEWGAEFKRNIHERELPAVTGTGGTWVRNDYGGWSKMDAPVAIVKPKFANNTGRNRMYNGDGNRKGQAGWGKTFVEYQKEWESFEFTTPDTLDEDMDIFEYIECREEGYTLEEIQMWGSACLYYDAPEWRKLVKENGWEAPADGAEEPMESESEPEPEPKRKGRKNRKKGAKP